MEHRLLSIIFINKLCIFRGCELELEALIFYHACYNSVERAKSCMDAYYSVRTHSPEFFANRDVAGADIAAQMKIM